jgi:hypothetical protein
MPGLTTILLFTLSKVAGMTGARHHVLPGGGGISQNFFFFAYAGLKPRPS